MVSFEQNDAVSVVRQGLTGRREMDEQVLASAMTLTERLGRLKAAGGLFEQISFSPQMEALATGHLTGAASFAV